VRGTRRKGRKAKVACLPDHQSEFLHTYNAHKKHYVEALSKIWALETVHPKVGLAGVEQVGKPTCLVFRMQTFNVASNVQIFRHLNLCNLDANS
jgi:hypothetical protein